MAATTFDDIWFPLIKKKGLNKKPVAAEVSGLSDLSARYRIIPRASQLAQAVEVRVLARVGCLRIQLRHCVFWSVLWLAQEYLYEFELDIVPPRRATRLDPLR